MRLSINNPKGVLVGVIVVATLLRLGAALYMGNTIETLPGIHDQVSYDALAKRVTDGYGFSFETSWWPATRAGEPTAHWSFLYTLYLSAVYTLFGPNPIAARLIQAVLAGVLHPWLSWRIGKRLFGPKVGLTAAALTSVYAYFVYYAAALMTETFYILAILGLLDLAVVMSLRSRHRSKSRVSPFQVEWNYYFLLGAILGTAALLRQVIIIFVPFLFLWFLYMRSRMKPVSRASSGQRELIVGLALATLIAALMIAPWTLRNYRVFDRFVLLNTNAGFAFFWGNHPIHGNDFIPILPADGPSYQDLIPLELKSLDEAALDQALLGRGFGFVTQEPIRYLRLTLDRAQEYFKFWPSSQSGLGSNIARVLSFGICLPFIVIGIVTVFVSKDYRKGGMWSTDGPVLLLCFFMLVYTSIHLLSWTLIRYRLPVDAILIIFAAVGLLSVTRLVFRIDTAQLQQTPVTGSHSGLLHPIKSPLTRPPVTKNYDCSK